MKLRRFLARTACLVCSLTTLTAGQNVEPPSDAAVEADAAAQADVPSGGMSISPQPSSPVEAPSASLSIPPDATTQAKLRARLTSGAFHFCTSDSYRLWQLDKDRLCSKVPELA